MKCPHCHEEVDADLNSPEALLIHVRKNFVKLSNDYQRLLDCHGEENETARKRKKQAEKYKAWMTWIEEKLK